MPLGNYASLQTIEIVDSHTGGEPTRVVLSGGPDLGNGALFERRARFSREFDHFRRAVVNEPRGGDVWVGALLCEPHAQNCVAGVIFFNNVGMLGMCGHGTIGLATTLAHLGEIGVGEHFFDTPVGVVKAILSEDGRVAVGNVSSFRRGSAEVEVAGLGRVRGDIAWGGNWFFLVGPQFHRQILSLENAADLTQLSQNIKNSLQKSGICGANGAEIDHIELFDAPHDPKNDARNFVLCPGGAYDRSPCGTGTSAKLACLFADGKLQEGQIWRQESISGSVFEGQISVKNGEIWPTITGEAFINARSTFLIDPRDPLAWGF